MTVKPLLAISALLAACAIVSSCGLPGPLEKAPPIYDKDGKPVKRETEKSLPTAGQKNTMPNPYTDNKSIRDAPLEGTGNAQGH